MYLNRLDEENKKPFLNLCNLLVEGEKKQSEAVEVIKAYCREMEVPYSKTAEGTFKRAAFELAETGDCGIIAFALIPIARLTETEESLEAFFKYADMEDDFEEYDCQYDELEDVLTTIESEWGLLNNLDVENKKPFLNLCNLLVEGEKNQGEAVKVIKAYCREMEIPYSAASEGTFKHVAFELAETRDCNIIASALMLLAKLTETEESLEDFLKYADMEDEFEELDYQYDRLKDVLDEVENLNCF